MKDMKKELYVKPEIVVVELEPEVVLAASIYLEGSGQATDLNHGDESVGADAQGRRGGGWGSLWD